MPPLFFLRHTTLGKLLAFVSILLLFSSFQTCPMHRNCTLGHNSPFCTTRTDVFSCDFCPMPISPIRLSAQFISSMHYCSLPTLFPPIPSFFNLPHSFTFQSEYSFQVNSHHGRVPHTFGTVLLDSQPPDLNDHFFLDFEATFPYLPPTRFPTVPFPLRCH